MRCWNVISGSLAAAAVALCAAWLIAGEEGGPRERRPEKPVAGAPPRDRAAGEAAERGERRDPARPARREGFDRGPRPDRVGPPDVERRGPPDLERRGAPEGERRGPPEAQRRGPPEGVRRGPPDAEGRGPMGPPREGDFDRPPRPGELPPRPPREQWEALERNDPELFKLAQEDLRLEREVHELTMRFRHAPPPTREAIKKEIAELVGKHFEIRLERRVIELKRVEAELQRLRESIERRKAARQQIIERRLGELLGKDDDLRF